MSKFSNEEITTTGGKKDKTPVVVYDTGEFTHQTGDTYSGSFELKQKDMCFKMHGPGVYTTAEGDSYSGIWEGNKLVGLPNEEVTIKYHTGAKYEGCFSDWAYKGKSRYTYPDGSTLDANFHDNCPQDKLRLTDPNGHEWGGKAETGFALLGPRNHYYDVLTKASEKTESEPEQTKTKKVGKKK